MSDEGRCSMNLAFLCAANLRLVRQWEHSETLLTYSTKDHMMKGGRKAVSGKRVKKRYCIWT